MDPSETNSEPYANTEVNEAFRDKINTVDQSGKRIWLYPKMPKGWYYKWRKILSYVLLVFLIGIPFIKVNGEPFVLFNIIESEFIVFGVFFTLQDFHLFVIATLIAILFITLFTVIYGRLFCGWVCPQTIFMEMVFRRVEYWIEGDANAQRRLAKASWSIDKYAKKIGKHLIFILISAVIAHTFLSYIIGVDQVWSIMTDSISEHWQGFTAMVIFTGVFYGVFSTMREQVCTTICPYGRLQGVLLDKQSLAVIYDFERGEPRGKISKKNPNQSLGDCIDCNLCVQVCPTGIDIRHGTQLECVNCTACMDACDEVMVKIDRPTSLIRIDSYNGVINGVRKIWNKRVAAYSLVLMMLIGLESFLLVTRSDVETLFLRTPGMLYQDQNDGYISNLYNYQLINKTDQEYEVTFEVIDIDGVIFQHIGDAPRTIKNQTSEGAIFIKIPKESLKGRKTQLSIIVSAEGRIVDEVSTSFLGPG